MTVINDMAVIIVSGAFVTTGAYIAFIFSDIVMGFFNRD